MNPHKRKTYKYTCSLFLWSFGCFQIDNFLENYYFDGVLEFKTVMGDSHTQGRLTNTHILGFLFALFCRSLLVWEYILFIVPFLSCGASELIHFCIVSIWIKFDLWLFSLVFWFLGAPLVCFNFSLVHIFCTYLLLMAVLLIWFYKFALILFLFFILIFFLVSLLLEFLSQAYLFLIL